MLLRRAAPHDGTRHAVAPTKPAQSVARGLQPKDTQSQDRDEGADPIRQTASPLPFWPVPTPRMYPPHLVSSRGGILNHTIQRVKWPDGDLRSRRWPPILLFEVCNLMISASARRAVVATVFIALTPILWAQERFTAKV